MICRTILNETSYFGKGAIKIIKNISRFMRRMKECKQWKKKRAWARNCRKN